MIPGKGGGHADILQGEAICKKGKKSQGRQEKESGRRGPHLLIQCRRKESEVGAPRKGRERGAEAGFKKRQEKGAPQKKR